MVQADLKTFLLNAEARLAAEPLPPIAWQNLAKRDSELLRAVLQRPQGAALALHTLSTGNPTANDAWIAELSGSSLGRDFQLGLSSILSHPEVLPRNRSATLPLAGYIQVSTFGMRAPELVEHLFWTIENSPHVRFQESAFIHLMTGFPDRLKQDPVRVHRAVFRTPLGSAITAAGREVLLKPLNPESTIPTLERIFTDRWQPASVRKEAALWMAKLLLCQLNRRPFPGVSGANQE